jgi:hypothetical protein
VSAWWFWQGTGACTRPHAKPPSRRVRHSKASGATWLGQSAACTPRLVRPWPLCFMPKVALSLAASPIPSWGLCASRPDIRQAAPVLIRPEKAVWRCTTVMPVAPALEAGPRPMSQSVGHLQEAQQAPQVRWCCRPGSQERPSVMARMQHTRPDTSGLTRRTPQGLSTRRACQHRFWVRPCAGTNWVEWALSGGWSARCVLTMLQKYVIASRG